MQYPEYCSRTFFQLRRADPSMVLGPMDRTVTTKNSFLNSEKGFPNGSEECKKYVQGVYITNGKLKLSMRLRNQRSYQEIRALMNNNLADTGITMSFDEIDSSSIFGAGWFKFAHPRFLNRDRLLQFMIDQYHDETIASKINIYPRQFWEKDDTEGRVRSDLLYVVGAWDARDDIMDFLLNVQWQDKYKDITFVPFQTNENFTKAHQVRAMREHNEYCTTIASEVIHISNPDAVLDSDGDEELTFTNWLSTRCYDYDDIFYDVDKIGEGVIAISYYKNKLNNVTGLIDRMHLILAEEFDEDVIELIFGSRTKTHIRRSVNRSAQRHLNALASKSNPQDDIESRRPQRVQILYDSEPIKDDSQSSCAAIAKLSKNQPRGNPTSKTNDVVASSSEITELRERIDRLDQSHKKLEQSVTTKATNNVLDIMNPKLDAVEQKLQNRITNIDNKHAGTIKRFLKNGMFGTRRRKNSFLDCVMETVIPFKTLVHPTMEMLE